MANVPETPSFDAGIYQIETTDPVLGGPNGIANAQAKGLANRTAFLKQQIDQLNSGQLTPSWIASQAYVKGELEKLDTKQSVRAATVANITLSGAQTVDGVALTVGDRVLVKDQTSAVQNGIYLVAAQNWSRTTDSDSNDKLTPGIRVYVESGTVNAQKTWFLGNESPVTVGVTSLFFYDEHHPASESTPGPAKIATQEQTNAGIDDFSIVTPKKIRAGLSILIGSVGYIALPTWLGGLIIQWGSGTGSGTNDVSITFPIAFPNACLSATVSCDYTPGSGGVGYVACSKGRTGIVCRSSGVYSTNWIAIGH